MKHLLLIVLTISIISCDKPELIDDIDAIQPALASYTNSTTSKSTATVVIQNDANATVLNRENNTTVKEALLVEDLTTEHPNVIGSMAYYIDGIDNLVITVNYADGSKQKHDVIAVGNYTIN